MLEPIKNQAHLEKVVKDRPLLLVVFFKPDSSISLETLDVLEELKQENPELAIGSVDVATVQDIHRHYQIDSVPTVLVFRHQKTAELIKGKQSLGYYQKLFSAFKARSHTDGATASSVTVYTTPTCRYCTAVKAYLKEKSVSFKEVDIAADPKTAQTLVAKTGQQGVPQIDINGQFVVGFNRPEIDRLLHL